MLPFPVSVKNGAMLECSQSRGSGPTSVGPAGFLDELRDLSLGDVTGAPHSLVNHDLLALHWLLHIIPLAVTSCF